jgi:hypothetical protein
MTKLRFASALAGLAFLAACADTPTGVTPDAETPAGVASFDGSTPTLTVWTKGQTTPAGFAPQGNTLACLGAGVKLDIASDTPTSGSLASGLISYTITGTTVSFESELPITYAAVKGGVNTNVYTFEPAANEATNLQTPMQTVGGGRNRRTTQAGLSHFSLCVGNPAPVVTLDADGEFTRTFDWTISKTAGAATVATNGLSAVQSYTVAIAKADTTDSDSTATGSITIANPLSTGPSLTVVGVTVGGIDIGSSLDCGAALPIAVAPGSSITCTWAADTDVTAYTVTVDVDNLAFTIPGLDGQLQWEEPAVANGSIAYVVGTTVNDEVEFSDSEETEFNGDLFTEGTSLDYDLTWTWTCGTGMASFSNTATIESTDTELSESSTANVSYARPDCGVAPPPAGDVCAVPTVVTGQGDFSWTAGDPTIPTGGRVGYIIKSDEGWDEGQNSRTYVITANTYITNIAGGVKAGTGVGYVDLTLGQTSTLTTTHNGNPSTWNISWDSRVNNGDGTWTYTVTITGGTVLNGLSHATFLLGCPPAV